MAEYPECPKCLDIFGNNRKHIKAPKILKCGDSICKECLEQIIKDTNEEFFICPKCEEKIKNLKDVDEYITNNDLIKVIVDSFNIPVTEADKLDLDSITTYNVISLGNASVGKTSIFTRLSKDNFFDNQLGTAGLDTTIYYIKYKTKNYQLYFRDPAGQEKYKALTKNFLRNSDGVLFIFDISNKKTFDDLEEWFNFYKEENEKVIGLLIGNKCDLKREVTEKEAEKFANDHGLKYLETSAKLDKKVKKAIACPLELMINSNSEPKKEKYLQIENYSLFSQKEKKKKCCRF